VRKILDHVEAQTTGLMAVMGDFNDWLPGRSVVHALEAKFGASPRPRTFPVFWPLLPLDRIWVLPGANLRSVEVHESPLAKVASDHLPLVAMVEIG
jgi:endonuclease/exonuclease/phosphatase family metal-dependent hydrolase